MKVSSHHLCSNPGTMPNSGHSSSEGISGGSLFDNADGECGHEAAADEVSSDSSADGDKPTQPLGDHSNVDDCDDEAADNKANLNVTQETEVTELNTTFDMSDDHSDGSRSSNNSSHHSSAPLDTTCTNCKRMESEKQKLQHELSMAERAVDLFEGKCQQYQELIETLECNNDELQSELDASLEKGDSYNKEIANLASKLREAEDQLDSSSREIDMAAERQSALKSKISALDYTIELLAEDYRNATELYMDAKDDVVKAALDGNDVANECIAKIQEEKADLEKEFQKISKEWFETMDKLDLSEKQNREVVDKVNEKLKDANQTIHVMKRSVAEVEEKNNIMTKEHDGVVANLIKERDMALSTIEDLAERCKRLVLDLEISSARLVEVTTLKDDAEYTVEVLSNELRDSDAKHVVLQSMLEELEKEKEESEAELSQRYFAADTNVKLLSDQVLFSNDEISRLSSERDVLSNEYEAQLQKVNERVDELTAEIARKDKEYQELWAQSNNTLLEKESATETVKELRGDVKRTAEFIDQRNMLFREVKTLEQENEQQQRRIEDMIKREHNLKQKNRLLASSLTPSQSKLQDEVESLRKQNKAMSVQLDTLEAVHRKEIEAIKAKFQVDLEETNSEQADLRWKIDAMQQHIELRLKEKDSMIAQLSNQLQVYTNENSRLQTEIHLGVLENDTVKSLMDTLARLEAMIEDQQQELEQKEVELEEKDSIISNLITRKRRPKPEITPMRFNE